MTLTRQLLIFATATAGFASNSYARTWPDAGGWTIAEANNGCYMTSEFEGAGDTELTLYLHIDGKQNILLENSNWSVTEGQKYPLRYLLNGSEYSGAESLGLSPTPKPSFGARMNGDFAVDFAKASGLKIYNGDTLVDSLSLSGSGAGVAMLRRCTASMKVRVDAENREKARLAYIPKDPFASAAPIPISKGGPLVSQASWVTNDDYPPSAIRNGEHGIVTVDYSVNAQGRVEGCNVKVSSGSAALDDTTCRLVTRRGKFTPGKVGTDRQSFTHTWRLPED
jgi:TonB family protein